MSTLITCAALAAVTVLVTVYTSAQRHRLRVLEARIAAAKAELAELHSGPTVERAETVLTTWAAAQNRCESTLRPHWLAARAALREHPGCVVEITHFGRPYWIGADEGALSAWIDSMGGYGWATSGNICTTMTRRIPAPPTEPTE